MREFSGKGDVLAVALHDPQRRQLAISGRELRRHRTAFLFLLPTLIIYLTFMVYPFIGSIQLSLTSWNGVDAVKEWVGLDNYVTALSADPVMREALWHRGLTQVVLRGRGVATN